MHISTNDVKFHCKPSDIIAGIVHVVEEARRMKPHAKIAINSILPAKDIHLDAWKTIRNVNNGLKLPIESLDDKNVYFFDAYRAFHDSSTNNIRRGLYMGPVHLSPDGYDRWGTAIVDWTKNTCALFYRNDF